MEGGNFFPNGGIVQFLLDILSQEEVLLHPTGRILCPNGFHLVWPNVADSSISPSNAQSPQIDSLPSLAYHVYEQVHLITSDPRHRYQKFLPIAMDSVSHKFHRWHCVDDEFLQPSTWNLATPVAVRAAEEEVSDPEKDCSICSEALSVGHRATRLPCTHLFHAQCISIWLEKASSCPNCRAPASMPLGQGKNKVLEQ